MGQLHAVVHVVLSVSHHVAVGSNGLGRLKALGIAITHLARNLPSATAFLWSRLLISLAIFIGGIVVFAKGEIFLTPAEIALGPA